MKHYILKCLLYTLGYTFCSFVAFISYWSFNNHEHVPGILLATRHTTANNIEGVSDLKGFKMLSILRPIQFSSVQFSLSVVSDSLRPRESQHIRPPCPSPTPGIHSNSHPSSWWWHPAISSSVIPFFSCPQSLQHQGLFQWVNSSHEVAKVLEFQLQHQSFQWTPRTDLL